MRAIAILAVVAFHARVPGFTGGFTGVDVFFVLSGYLITRLLLREHDATGRISIAEFYARRGRRLLPALALVLAFVLAAGTLLDASADRQRLAESAAAAALFVANLLFYRRADDYFADTGHPDALTHTWSLSVEEQFYLVWPLALWGLLALTRRRARWAVPTAMIVIAVASLVAASMAAPKSVAAFYLPTSRAWELAIGALLAWMHERTTRIEARTSSWAGWAGMVAIVAAAFVLSASAAAKPWLLLLPTLGSALVIANVMRSPDASVARLLGSAPLVWIGRRSYGWYLWHFPLLVFAQYAGASFALKLGAVLGSLVVAHMSYTFVELPIRERRWTYFATTRGMLRAGALATALIATAGFGMRDQVQRQRERAQGSAYDWLGARCGLEPLAMENGATCDLGAADSTRVLVLWGDSEAQSLAPLVDAIGTKTGTRVQLAWLPGCPPLVGFSSPLSREPERCLRLADSVLSGIRRERERVIGVVLAARWTRVFGSAPRDPSARADFFARVSPADTGALRLRASQAVVTTLRDLGDLGVRTLVVEQPPEWSSDPLDCVLVNVLRGPRDCSESRREIEAFQATSAAELRDASRIVRDVRILTFNSFLCSGTSCSPLRGGVSSFYDQIHFSAAGAIALADETRCAFEWVLSAQSRGDCLALQGNE